MVQRVSYKIGDDELILETGKIGLKEKSEFIREKLDILAS